MGLEKEIERIFQRAMESDLELIAQDACADSTPQGSCMCACGIIATVADNEKNETPFEEQLYSIKRIVFQRRKDFWDLVKGRIEHGHELQAGPHSELLQALLQQWREAEAKGDSRLLEQLDNKIGGLVGVLSQHYRDEGPAVTIVPRCEWKVISLGVLDYVREDCWDATKLRELLRDNQLHIPAIGPLERWPEVLVMNDRPSKQKIYRRVDMPLGAAGLLPPVPLPDGPNGPPGTRRIPMKPDGATLQKVKDRLARRVPGRTRVEVAAVTKRRVGTDGARKNQKAGRTLLS